MKVKFLSHNTFESENFRFPFFYGKYPNLGSEIWKIKRQKNVGREFIWSASKIVQEQNCHLEIFSLSQVIKISRQYLLLPRNVLQENSRWVPLGLPNTPTIPASNKNDIGTRELI